MVVLALRGPAGPQRVGQPVRIDVEVRNAGTGEIWLVGVVDGSEDGARYPHYRPSVSHGGVVVAAPPPPEDPLVSPLRPADFRRLAGGEPFDPTLSREGAAYLPLSTFATFRPAAPGVYRFSLTLSTESETPELWLGRFGQDAGRGAVLALISRVPRVTITSTIDVAVG